MARFKYLLRYCTKLDITTDLGIPHKSLERTESDLLRQYFRICCLLAHPPKEGGHGGSTQANNLSIGYFSVRSMEESDRVIPSSPSWSRNPCRYGSRFVNLGPLVRVLYFSTWGGTLTLCVRQWPRLVNCDHMLELGMIMRIHCARISCFFHSLSGQLQNYEVLYPSVFHSVNERHQAA